MELTEAQRKKVTADQWYGDTYQHVRANEALQDRDDGDADAKGGMAYHRLASPFGVELLSKQPLGYGELSVEGGELTVRFSEPGLRNVAASVRAAADGGGKLRIVALDSAGAELKRVDETLGGGRTDLLFENLPRDLRELRFTGVPFVFLMARAAGAFSLDPPSW
jgi:hypothetical protein